MTNTGLFHLQDVSGSSDDGQFSCITSVRATCLNCSRALDASAPPELETIKGGAILYCPGFGTRQAISNARFEVLVNGAVAQKAK
jgi:hypothetical protein